MTTPTTGWTIRQWRDSATDPTRHLNRLMQLRDALDTQDAAWISLNTHEDIQRQLVAASERGGAPGSLPLFGVPFAVKDNIDVQGLPTTAACSAFAYDAETDSTVVGQLRRAGAIVVGKTNLDQFATGLVGTRSPYGRVTNPFNAAFLAGGSSSGSGVVVGRGLVPFALGTDTAGSGRVPAAFNNIVGIKPTKGWLSTSGLVPACRTLDCISVFALTVGDAELVTKLCAGYDDSDPYSRVAPSSGASPSTRTRWLGIVEHPEFFGDSQAQAAYEATLAHLRNDGFRFEAIDFSPFAALAELLYGGPWLSERVLAVGDIPARARGDMDAIVFRILTDRAPATAEDAFAAEYRRATLAREIHRILSNLDALLLPTTPTIYRLADVEADPIQTNSRLGTYTNFANLADLCAVAVPGAFRQDGLPTGVTLFGSAWQDEKLCALARHVERCLSLPLGATSLPRPTELSSPTEAARAPVAGSIRVAVVGAHMRGMPLNHQLIERDATFVARTTTASAYRLFALPNTSPAKPGVVRSHDGASIVLEIWEMSLNAFGSFVASVPPPLSIGNVELTDGTWVKGFLCEHWATEGATDITAFGGFREYLEGT